MRKPPCFGLVNESIGILTGAIAATTALASIVAFSRPEMIRDLLFEVGAVRRGEYIRLFSAGILHAHWGHLLVNLFSFFFFANPMEQLYGPVVVGVVFVVGVLGGNLLALVLHWNDLNYRALGASGGVCGVIFASVFLLPGASVIVFPVPIPIPSWLYAILFVAYSVYGARAQHDNIGHDAHLGGALVGLLAATALYPGIVAVNPLLYAAVLGGGVVAVGYLYRLSRKIL